MREGSAGILAALCVRPIAVSGAPPAPGGYGKPPRVTIRTTEGGVPRILADTLYGAGYGYGYVLAKENICSMAQIYTTVRGERSRYFGPDETWTFTGNGRTYTNLQGDFFFRRAIAERTIEMLLLKKPPNGPLRDPPGRQGLCPRLQPLPAAHGCRQPARRDLPRRRLGQADHRP